MTMSTGPQDVESASPPPYHSLYGEIKGAQKESNNFAEFLGKLCMPLASTIGFVILNGIFLGIPISMIVMGAKHKDDCPKEDMIPIYLIVAGVFLIARNISLLYARRLRGNDGDGTEDERSTAQKCCDSVVDLFLFAWFITGNYWIYHIHEPSYDSSDGDEYCNKSLYLFSFWITTSTYILFGFICCCLCCMYVCVSAISDDE